MNETNTAVIARLDRATQYSRDASDRMRSRGVLDRPVKPGDDSFVVAGVFHYHLFKKFSASPGRAQSIAISSPLPDNVM
jgi:hypothetical protein